MSSSTTLSVAASSSSVIPTATPVGVLQGQNPLIYSAADPLILFSVQAVIIIVTCRLLHYPLSKIRQPRVIAEVVGGILLGPSVMGRIPNFTKTIFPATAAPNLTLVANIGLVFFLFLVGLEVDLRIMLRNARVAITVSLMGMILPFGLGCAIAVGIYNNFSVGASQPSFGIFLLFMGVSFSITAFPVLARILTELKLLQTAVGVITLSAGVGNDVTGWVLLALTVALVNASNGITVLYVILCSIGIILVLVFLVRPVFIYFAKKGGGLQRGPSEMMMAVIILLVLTAAFYTDIIGIHPIFGGFLVGLIIPHEQGFAVRVTEKIEDFISALFLPLYFALSGLKTNIGLLDDGLTWGYTIGIILIALFSKICGSTLAARLNGMVWRESFTIGVLMSCKGLVELIVLNVGLQAGILSQRVFTMFVVMALVTTFLTTPIVSFLYPPWYQRKIDLWRRGEIDWDGNPIIQSEDTSPSDEKMSPNDPLVQKCMVVLNRMEDLPTMMTVTKLLASAPREPPTHPLSPENSNILKVHCLRLMELTQRTSAVMKVSERHFDRLDPVINVFRTFGQLNEVLVTAKMAIVPDSSFADSVHTQARDSKSEMVIVPWTSHFAQVTGGPSTIPPDEFIKNVLEKVESHVSVMIDTNLYIDDESPSEPSLSRSISTSSLRNRFTKSTNSEIEAAPVLHLQEGYHVFLPYFGGKDDRIALLTVLQLIRCPDVKATIIKIRSIDEMVDSPIASPSAAHTKPQKDEGLSTEAVDNQSTSSPFSAAISSAMSKVVHFPRSLDAAANSVPADDPEYIEEEAIIDAILEAIPAERKTRLIIENVTTSTPLQYAVKRAKKNIDTNATNYHLVIVGRGIKFPRRENQAAILRKDLRDSVKGRQNNDMMGKSCLGDAGEAMLLGRVSGGLLVVQSSNGEGYLHNKRNDQVLREMAPVDSDSSSENLESKVLRPQKTDSADLVDHYENVANAESSSSTSSEYMGPSYGHSVPDAWEENFGIFARAKEEGVLDHVLDYYGLQHEDIVPRRTKKEANRPLAGSSRMREISNQEQRQETRTSKPKVTQLDHPQPAKKVPVKKEESTGKAGRLHKENEGQSKAQRKDKKGPDVPGRAQNFYVAPVLVEPISKLNALGGITEMTTPPHADAPIKESLKQGVGSHSVASQSLVVAKDTPPSVDDLVIANSQVRSHDLNTVASLQPGKPFFAYTTGYYMSAALVAAAASTLGIIAFVLPAFKRSQRVKEKNDATTKNSRRRLHVRDWQRPHEC